MTPAPLRVSGAGMATAVGLSADAGCAAIRARIKGFAETRILGQDGVRVVGAEVPLDEPARGLDRLVRLVSGPVLECLDVAPGLAPSDIPLLVGVAEPGRPGRPPALDERLLPDLEAALGFAFHPASRVVALGRVAGALCLREASRVLGKGGVRRVIVAGVDSYLVPATLAEFARAGRLLGPDSSNGFVPGEAGAALLLARGDAEPGLAVRSLGFSAEAARIGGEEVLRGDGLAAAYREALRAAGLGLHDMSYRIADLSGEQFWFKEAALAMARVMRVRREDQELWHPADCIGETGAAAVPCMLAVALDAARKGYAPGALALAQAANDDGRRAAMVLDGAGAA